MVRVIFRTVYGTRGTIEGTGLDKMIRRIKRHDIRGICSTFGLALDTRKVDTLGRIVLGAWGRCPRCWRRDALRLDLSNQMARCGNCTFRGDAIELVRAYRKITREDAIAFLIMADRILSQWDRCLNEKSPKEDKLRFTFVG